MRLISEEVIRKYCHGDNTVEESIVNAHMPLVVTLAAAAAKCRPTLRHDLESLSTLALIESVRKFRQVHVDYGITKYISSYVYRRLRFYILNYRSSVIIDQDLCAHTYVDSDEDRYDALEAFSHAAITPKQKEVIGLRLQGYTLDEIAEKVGYKRYQVVRTLEKIYERLKDEHGDIV